MEFINDTTGQPLVFSEDLKPEQVFVGNILTTEDDEGRHHFQVKSIEGFPKEPAHMIPARSNLGNVIFLLGSLAVIWFGLDWLFTYFTS